MTIFREEGPAALYKGFVPKVLRLAPGGGVLLLVVEVTLGFFRTGKFLLPSFVYGDVNVEMGSPWTTLYLDYSRVEVLIRLWKYRILARCNLSARGWCCEQSQHGGLYFSMLSGTAS